MSESVAETQVPSTYRRILAATSVLGGAAAINMSVSLIRGKVVALWIGPEGSGIMSMLMQISGMAVALFSCGLAMSGVRELAEARGSGDEDRVRKVALTFRRLSWGLGLAGTLVLAALAYPLSKMSFGNSDHVWDIMLVSLTIFVGMVGAYEASVIQACGMLKSVAALNVVSVVLGALSTIVCLILWKQDGITPSLVGAVLMQWVAARYFARSAPMPLASPSTRFDRAIMRRLLALGAFAAGIGFLASWAMYPVRALLIHHTQTVGAGLYQAAMTLSSQFATFILAAMGSDFFPRLSAAVGDKPAFNRMLNEQTEVALQLGIPGVVATIGFAPVLIPLLNSNAYLGAAPVLQLLAIGVFGRLLSWPLSFALMARREVKLSLCGEIIQHATHIASVWLLLPGFGVSGAGAASIIVYVAYSAALCWFVSIRTGFRWSRAVWQALIVGVIAMGLSLWCDWCLTAPWKWVANGTLLAVCTGYSLSVIARSARVTQVGFARRVAGWFQRSPAKDEEQ